MPKYPKRRQSYLRKGRHSIPGAYYSVTLSTQNRDPILVNTDVASIIFGSFDWLESKERFNWICIMVMPEHVHAIFQLGKTHPLPNVLKSLKNYTAKNINICVGRSGTLWQQGYYDHGIRIDESLKALIRYFYENPVRRGLVTQARDYPLWRCKYKME